jgi:hypothetical protein
MYLLTVVTPLARMTKTGSPIGQSEAETAVAAGRLEEGLGTIGFHRKPETAVGLPAKKRMISGNPTVLKFNGQGRSKLSIQPVIGLDYSQRRIRSLNGLGPWNV